MEDQVPVKFMGAAMFYNLEPTTAQYGVREWRTSDTNPSLIPPQSITVLS